MFYTYVLQSLSDPTYHYKGHCENLETRLKEHNGGSTKSNKHKAPFDVVYFETSETRIGAVKKEKYWKTAAGRRYLQTKISAVP
jgi:putative endonuclease